MVTGLGEDFRAESGSATARTVSQGTGASPTRQPAAVSAFRFLLVIVMGSPFGAFTRPCSQQGPKPCFSHIEDKAFVFVNPAVFAPSAGPVPDLRPEPSVHQAAPIWPSIRRALA
jgi:hypothetical protein